MILGQVSYLDCFSFLGFLAPQLLIHVGFWQTFVCVLQALPFLRKQTFQCIMPSPCCQQMWIDKFLVVQLPLQFLFERFLTRKRNQSPFVQQASIFQDIVIRCVRYAFAGIPADIGRVFFSKGVALPFLRFRMLRHGYLRSPIYWREVNCVSHHHAISDELPSYEGAESMERTVLKGSGLRLMSLGNRTL